MVASIPFRINIIICHVRLRSPSVQGFSMRRRQQRELRWGGRPSISKVVASQDNAPSFLPLLGSVVHSRSYELVELEPNDWKFIFPSCLINTTEETWICICRKESPAENIPPIGSNGISPSFRCCRRFPFLLALSETLVNHSLRARWERQQFFTIADAPPWYPNSSPLYCFYISY